MPVAIKKTSKKRKAAYVLFLIIVTLVVLYSYCYGKSICYTMPLFTDWSRVTLTETKHGLVLTSSVVLKAGVAEKHGNYREETNGKTGLTQGNENATTVNVANTVDNSFDGESDDSDNTSNNPEDFSGSGFPLAMSGVSGEVGYSRLVHPIRPPSDITGEVADKILQVANISNAEAERGLVRVKRPLGKPIDITGKVAERILRRSHVPQKEADKELTRVKRIEKIDKNKMKSKLKKVKISENDAERGHRLKNKTRIESNVRKFVNLAKWKSYDDDKELVRVKRLGDEDNDDDDGNDNKDKIPGSGIHRTEFTNVNTSRSTLQGFGSLKPKITKKKLTFKASSVLQKAFLKKLEKIKNGKTVKDQLGNSSHFPFLVYNKTTAAVTVKNKTDVNKYHEIKGNLSKVDITHNISEINKNQSRENGKNILTEFKGRNLSHGERTEKIEKHDFSSSSRTYSMHPLGQLLSNLGSLKEHIKSDTDKKPQPMRSESTNSQTILKNSSTELQSIPSQRQNESELHSKTGAPSFLILRVNMASTHSRKSQNASLKTRDFSNGDENEKLSNIRLNSTAEGSAELLDETPLNDSIDGAKFQTGSGSDLNLEEVSGSGVDIEGEFDDVGSTKETNRIVSPTNVTPLTFPTQLVGENVVDAIKKKLTIHSLANGLLKYDVLNCDPLEPKVLLFNRIFKTGSSTTEFFIKKASRPLGYRYHLGTTEDWYDKTKPRLYPGLIVRKAAQKLTKSTPRMAFLAHFYFRQFLKLQRAHTYINQVREPIHRVISHYYYMRSKKRPKKQVKKFFKSKEFNETLEQCFQRQHRGCESNVMTRFFCGTPSYCRTGSKKALGRAIYNIKHFYGVVGLLEQYDAYLRVLHKRFPQFFTLIESPSKVRMKNNPKYDISNVSDRLKQLIKRANWADVNLYEFIRERFMKQAKSCGIALDR